MWGIEKNHFTQNYIMMTNPCSNFVGTSPKVTAWMSSYYMSKRCSGYLHVSIPKSTADHTCQTGHEDKKLSPIIDIWRNTSVLYRVNLHQYHSQNANKVPINFEIRQLWYTVEYSTRIHTMFDVTINFRTEWRYNGILRYNNHYSIAASTPAALLSSTFPLKMTCFTKINERNGTRWSRNLYPQN